MKIPPLVIGLTLVSMGTSMPEASVSINSSVNGLTDMSIGNIVGSDIFNTLLILGVSALIVPLSIGRDIKVYDIPVMVGIYVLLILFAFAITPLRLDWWEGVIFLALFVGYTAFLIVRTKRENKRAEAERGGKRRNGKRRRGAEENAALAEYSSGRHRPCGHYFRRRSRG